MGTTQPASVRVLARLLPALLCALCAFLVAPAPAHASAPARVHASEQAAAPVAVVPTATVGDIEPVPSAPDTHLSGAEAAELPAVVEQSVRFPAPPVAPPVVRGVDHAPVRGRVAGDPRRERAPPGLPYDPGAPRGPPSTRHS
ncbi:hypothetical protein [Streptomyces sp. NPDC058486]|uniref:hypothetical protein n=1 Tax=unclassified Streptomyces TaxID=2593676 RepID=UPI003667B988